MRIQLRGFAVVLLILLSLLVTEATAQSFETPDTKVRGVVRSVQREYTNVLNKKSYYLTAWVKVQITEIIEKGSNIPYESDFVQLGPTVDIGYNSSQWPDVRVDDLVEVYGLWVAIPFDPTSQMIRVDDALPGSYLKVIGVYDLSKVLQAPPNVQLIETGKEYANGSISQDGVDVWYTWINSSGTQVAFFTYYSTIYNSPIMAFLGQHYTTADGLEVFMGNTLLLMEAYRDANGNGVPDMDLTSGTGEIEYFLLVNSSLHFTPIPLEKRIVGGAPHYSWGIRHEGIDGFLLYPKDRIVNGFSTNLGAKVYIDHLAFTYDYYVQENVSYIKTGIDAGAITEVMPQVGADVSLSGLSLSLLYGTTAISSKPYTVLVNGQPYNSTIVKEPSVLAGRVEVVISDAKAYEFLFDENYTLHRDSMAESFKSKAVASATESVPPNARNYLSPDWIRGWLGRYLSDVFPQIKSMLGDLSLDYDTSSFVYRICYPIWDGQSIEHDPTYVAYLTTKPVDYGPGGPQAPSLPFEQLAVALIGLAVLTIALLELQRTRRLMKVNPFPLQV